MIFIIVIVIFLILIFLLLMVYLNILYQYYFKDLCYITIFNICPFIVTTGSMINSNNDSINIGDLIFIKHKSKKDKYEEGDIISFIKNDEVITHRIIKKNKKFYKTKGDNNKLSDKFNVIESKIIGKFIGKFKVNKLIIKNIPLRLFEFEIFTILFIIKYFLIDGVKKWK